MSTINHPSRIHVLGFAGSLRRGSLNRAALREAGTLLPEGMTLEIAQLDAIPLYNGDVEAAGLPEAVIQFRGRIKVADAILIATPEYNYSIPGVLKNALDWASVQGSPLNGKPVAIMGASAGLLGTARAQYHLRQVFVYLNMLPVNKPEVMIMKASEKFDTAGRLTDDPTRQQVAKLLDALADWTRRLRGW